MTRMRDKKHKKLTQMVQKLSRNAKSLRSNDDLRINNRLNVLNSL